MGLLRGRGSDPQASFVELFFDLVVVFALNRLVTTTVRGLQGGSPGHRWTTIVQAMLLILPLVWVWTITVYGTARFDPRRAGARGVILATALGVLLLGAAAPQAFDSTSVVFAGLYVALQAGRALALSLALRRHPLRQLFRGAFGWFCVSAVPWLAGAFLHGWPQLVLWSSAVAIDYGSARFGWPLPGLGRERVTAWATAAEHLAHRYRQLLMIALGEGILAVGIAFTNGPGFGSLAATLGLLVAFLTIVLFWQLYIYKAGLFIGTAVGMARDPARLGRVAATAHVLMIMGIVATATGQDLVQHRSGGQTYPTWLAVMLGGPAVFLGGRALLEWVVYSRLSVPRLLGAGALLLLSVPLALAPPLAVVAAVPVVLIVITVVDLQRAAGKPPEAPAPPGPPA
ncbi:low temperature requirement protein A [Micromonospora sp. PLK6-60]|uniref:low temperature requirement protein A n=1 Tax=Micromonospora sp. PLK6-60 TaxID=2873383 RepID=UPI001CA76411|nr:low temperature requirement protein A [Micromonospora sp. PLK6-60]MBY8870249.1 low temperature requirement protein A [Micromonospora sp. PLK6-60]